MIVGGRKPAKFAGTPSLEFSSFTRRRSNFAEFPFIIVLQPLFPVLISVPQILRPAMYARSHQPLCLIRQLQKALGRRPRQPQRWPPMHSPRLLLPSCSEARSRQDGPCAPVQFGRG